MVILVRNHKQFILLLSCSKASSTSWSCWDYCIQSWSSPPWLCPCHYLGPWRGTSIDDSCLWCISIKLKQLLTFHLGTSFLNILISFLCPIILVVKAALGWVLVFFDGGLRWRTNFLKALVLGAYGIFVSMMHIMLTIVFVTRQYFFVTKFMPGQKY